jgi:uncharacterized protein YecE (DUF72 family)
MGIGYGYPMIRVGTAGWTIPAAFREAFAGDGAHLTRYARVMNACEINSSFHRPHRRSTYERWAGAVPADFAFCVKLPKTISHEKRCTDCESELERFLDESAGLGEKRHLCLLQLPPSFAYDEAVMRRFFEACRALHAPQIVCEPRHASWFTDDAEAFLATQDVARAAADPVRVPGAAVPGGSTRLVYLRLHGSPRMYYSSYADDTLRAMAAVLHPAQEAWCIFDNTASGAALGDALRFRAYADSQQAGL